MQMTTQAQGTIASGGGSPPSPPDKGALDSDGYSTASEATAIGTITGATEGVGRRSGWLLQDWICQSSSQPIQVQK